MAARAAPLLAEANPSLGNNSYEHRLTVASGPQHQTGQDWDIRASAAGAAGSSSQGAGAAALQLSAHPVAPAGPAAVQAGSLSLAATVQARQAFARHLEAFMQQPAPNDLALPEGNQGNLKGTWKVASDRYRAYGWDDRGLQSHLGMFPSRLLAGRAADIYVLKCYGFKLKPKRLNFPPEVYVDLLPVMEPLTLEDVIKGLAAYAKSLKKASSNKEEQAPAALPLAGMGRQAIAASTSAGLNTTAEAGSQPAGAWDQDGAFAQLVPYETGSSIVNPGQAALTLETELLRLMQQDDSARSIVSGKGLTASANGRWHAQMTVNGKTMYLGTYSHQHAAAKAIDILRLKRGTSAVHFPDATYQNLVPFLEQLSPEEVRDQIFHVSRQLKPKPASKQARERQAGQGPAAKKQKRESTAAARQPEGTPPGEDPEQQDET